MHVEEYTVRGQEDNVWRRRQQVRPWVEARRYRDYRRLFCFIYRRVSGGVLWYRASTVPSVVH